MPILVYKLPVFALHLYFLISKMQLALLKKQGLEEVRAGKNRLNYSKEFSIFAPCQHSLMIVRDMSILKTTGCQQILYPWEIMEPNCEHIKLKNTQLHGYATQIQKRIKQKRIN